MPGRLPRLKSNIPKLLSLNAAWMFMVGMPVIVPFFKGYGLTMHQIYQLQTVFALSLVVFEVPSGYLADILGRKRCLVAASILYGTSFGILVAGEGFGAFVVFELFAALANSLFSGTDVAMLYDTLEEIDDQQPKSTQVLGRRLFWGQLGETIAALLGGALVLSSLALPLQVNAVVAWLPLLIALSLVEPPRAKLDIRHHRENFRLALHVLFRQSRLLRLILLNLVVYGLATLLAVWAFQDLWLHMNIPLGLFGILWAGYNLVVALTARHAHGLERRLGFSRTLMFIGLMPVLGYCCLGLFGWLAADALLWTVAALLSGLFFQVGRGVTQVVIRDALNTRVPTELRATANSVSSLGVRVAFALLGPLLGLSIDRQGYLPSFLLCGLLFLVVGLFCVSSLHREMKRVWR